MTDRMIHSRRSLAFAWLIATSFLIQYSNWILGTYIPYGLLMCAAMGILGLTALLEWKNLKFDRGHLMAAIRELDWLSFCWIPGVILVGLSCFVGGVGMKEILDVFTYVVCVFFVIFSGKREGVFYRSLQVILGFALYYAVTVWIQLIPPVYNLYLAVMPEEVSKTILKLQNVYACYTGFSTNAGFTAGHIVAGILVIVTRRRSGSAKSPVKDWAMLAFLFLSLMLTGKRFHLAAAVLVPCVCAVMGETGEKRLSRIRKLAVLGVVGLVLAIIAMNFLTFIPVVKRLTDTVIGVLNGEDISSGRGKLYAFAWELFRNHPVLGVGWSQYPDLMVGVVTKITPMDVHNIYLQLLAETGIVGFVLMVVPMVLTFWETLVLLNRRLKRGSSTPGEISALLFSLSYQMFFHLYGMTGNALYDYNYVILYFLSCAICVAAKRKERDTKAKSSSKSGRKKAGIITFHFAHNQGAVLQCYALQTFLTRLGCDAKVIDYRPAYHTVKYSAWKNPFRVARGNWRRNRKKPLVKRIVIAARGFARGLVADLKRTDRAADLKFRAFTEKFLRQTRTYTSLEELCWDPPAMDAYVSGSDQLWNPELLDYCFDPAYFMDFGGEKTRRLTYAVSLKEHYSKGQKAQLRKLCRRIDGLCIREENADLTQAVGREAKVCIDPSLLLDREDYLPLETKRKVAEPYVFVYGFETNEQILQAVQTVAEAKNLKIVNGSPKRIRLTVPCKRLFSYSPDEFLSYIHHADYVVTNSFHGTAFSVIYKKNFIVVAHSTRGRRMTELLGKLGLEGRIWRDATCDWKAPIDHGAAYEKLELLRGSARSYLTEQLFPERDSF